jgi:hypothetical protein
VKKIVSILTVLFLSLFGMTSLSSAQHMHGGMSMSTPMKMETREVLVEGVKVTFQIMANGEHQKMLKDMKMKEDVEPGTTHNITVTLKDEKTQKDIRYYRCSGCHEGGRSERERSDQGNGI